MSTHIQSSALGALVTLPPPPFNPLAWKDILTTAGITISRYYQADVGITETSPGSGVLSSWADQSGNAGNITAVGVPAFVATGLNGRGTVAADGTSDGLDLSWDPPDPDTTPTWIYCVMRQDTWVNGDRLWGGNGTTMRLVQSATTPLLRTGNTALVSDNPSMTLNTWYRIEAKYANSADGTTGDYLKVGSAGGTRGTAFGGSDPTGFSLFMADGGSLFGAGKVALFIVCTSEPSGAVKAALDALTIDAVLGYGASVGT